MSNLSLLMFPLNGVGLLREEERGYANFITLLLTMKKFYILGFYAIGKQCSSNKHASVFHWHFLFPNSGSGHGMSTFSSALCELYALFLKKIFTCTVGQKKKNYLFQYKSSYRNDTDHHGLLSPSI